MIPDRPDEIETPDVPAGISAGAIILLLLGLAVLWFFRPWFHGLFYGMTMKVPGVTQWLVLGLLTMGVSIYIATTSDGPARGATVAFWLGGIMIAFAFTGAILVDTVYMNEDLSDDVLAETTDVESVEELPAADANETRILPQAAGQTYAQNSLQYPRHKLANGDITVINGTPHWSYALQPDGFANTLRGQQAGAAYVNMTTENKDVRVEDQALECGQGQLVTDDYNWQLKKDTYWVEHKEPFMVPDENGELHLTTPEVSHELRFRLLPIPQVYSVPQYDGVHVLDRDCQTTSLSSSEAQESALLEGQNIYPYELTRTYVESTRWQHGAINKWFFHEDELELANVPGHGNDQPFTVMTERGITYVLAAEPAGDSSGVYQIWTVDARSGEMERLKVSQQSAMLGPGRATTYVRQANPRIDWDRMDPIEPLPTVTDGSLYWKVPVVPTDSAGVSYTAFVNADTGTVTEVQTDDELRAFVAGADVGTERGNGSAGNGSPSAPAPPAGNDSASGTLVVEIVNENGETVDVIEVDEGDRVEVRSGNETDG